jgi:two-component system nitrogen regulation response regulator NtrX
MSLDIIVIDDEMDIRDLVSDILKDEGFNPRAAGNSTQAFKLIADKLPAAIILDIWLEGSDLDGLGILEIVKKRYPLMPVIVISGHGTLDTAVSAIKMGAYDYLEKPFTHDKLVLVLKRACEATKLKRENLDLKSKIIDRTDLVGNCSVSSKLKADIEKVASTSCRVMIHGEIGSGKELAARLIHKKSKRANGPFVVYSPISGSADNTQQELFKELEIFNEKNPVITKQKLSILETANNGTLYIDEVGDLSPSAQVKLLSFLQNSMYEKSVNQSIKLDIRLITATTKNLQNEITLGKFRQDLYHRLNVVPIKMPSLSERKEDIAILVKHFVKQLAKSSGLKEREFADETISTLQSYNWPGNIRQLKNIIEWILIMNPVTPSGNNIIRPSMVPQEILNNNVAITKSEDNPDIMSMPLREAREVFEKQYLLAQMSRCNNNISKTSFCVGMERSALHRKLKLLNLHTSSKFLDDEEAYEECV